MRPQATPASAPVRARARARALPFVPALALTLTLTLTLSPSPARADGLHATARPAAARPTDPAAAIAARLLAYYASPRGYAAVRRDVLSWHKTTTNGCVAFASTALRHIGLSIPLDARIDDETVSRLTRPFSLYLERTLHFTRITDVATLRPGDIAFTENAAYPQHTFVFHSWIDPARRLARIIDNQGRLTRRPLLGSRAITPFAYALRPPP